MHTHHTAPGRRVPVAIGIALISVFTFLLLLQVARADAASGSIVFVSEQNGSAEVWTMNPDGSDQRQVTFTAGVDEHDPVPAGSTGQRIIVAKDNPDSGVSDLYVVDLVTGAERQLTSTSGLDEDDPTVVTGPSGVNRVVYSAIDRAGSSELYTVQLNGANQRQLTFTAEDEHDPVGVSSSGQRVVAARDNAALGTSDLFVINVITGEERQLTHTPRVAEDDPTVAVSEDGVVHAVFSATDVSGNADLRTWDSVSREVVKVNLGASAETSPTLSPDGSAYVYQSDRGDEFGIWTPPADGHGPRMIASGYQPSWMP